MRTAILTLFVVSLLVPGSADAEWINEFGAAGMGRSGTNGKVWALYADGSYLYVGGEFTEVDGAPAHLIARWDGTSWSSLGNPGFFADGGSDPTITTITSYQGDIVAAGYFTETSAQSGDIAVWNGSTWSTLGNDPLVSPGRPIYSLVADGSDLYIGGYMNDRVVRWDGATTHVMVDSISASFHEVRDMIVWNGDLIVIGWFNYLNTIPLWNVARWDGSTWQPFGGLEVAFAGASELFEHGGVLYAIGYRESGADVVKWNGSEWVDATTVDAFCTTVSDPIHDALFYQGNLYRTGVSQVVQGGSLFAVAGWDGFAWFDMDGGVNAACYNGTGPLAVYDGRLVVGGEFSEAGGLTVQNLAEWDGSRWRHRGLNDRGLAVETLGTSVFVAGDFDMAFDTPASGIAKWDGNSWTALGSGVNGAVHDMVTIGDDLYVGGVFTDAGGTGAKYVARWEDAASAWNPVGTELLGGEVFALATDGTHLYAGGTFLITGSTIVRRVAMWDGSQWNALGDGVQDNSVRALAWHDGILYAGGDFFHAGPSILTGNVARWDGANWSSVGNGRDDDVQALVIHQGELYAGGDFTNHVARWTGSTWETLFDGVANGTSGPVRTMTSSAAGLVVGGEFISVGPATANRIALWDGAAWQTLDGGLNNVVDGVAAYGGNLWVTGDFTRSGDVSAQHVAQWNITATAVGGDTPPRASLLGNPYPNPFNPATTIPYRLDRTARVTIAIYGVDGALVRTLVDREMAPGSGVVAWDGRDDRGVRAASGVYHVRMRAGQAVDTGKLTLLK